MVSLEDVGERRCPSRMCHDHVGLNGPARDGGPPPKFVVNLVQWDDLCLASRHWIMHQCRQGSTNGIGDD